MISATSSKHMLVLTLPPPVVRGVRLLVQPPTLSARAVLRSITVPFTSSRVADVALLVAVFETNATKRLVVFGR